MRVSRSPRQTQIHAIALGDSMMHATLSRSAHADQLEAEVRGAHCCAHLARCADCHAKLDEVRAARRDALIHSVASMRQRRAVL